MDKEESRRTAPLRVLTRLTVVLQLGQLPSKFSSWASLNAHARPEATQLRAERLHWPMQVAASLSYASFVKVRARVTLTPPRQPLS